jgi:hypothetical protein
MAKHKEEAIGSRHPGVSWEYNDATARGSASGFTASDLGGIAWQKSDDSLWLLTATTPTWVQVGVGDADAIHKSVASEIYNLTNKASPVSGDVILGEDSANGYSKIKIAISSLGGGGSNSMFGYIYGLNLKCDSPGQYCYVSTGSCRNDDDDDFITVSSQLTIDSEASAGANAIDTGTVAASTQYYVFVIYNPTSSTTAAIFSLSRTSPTMPSGYTKKRFIGSVRTDVDSDFLYMESFNMGATKYVQYEDEYSVLSGGTQTSWTDIDCSGYVPPDASSCEVLIEQGAASGTVYVRPNGKTRNWVYLYRYSSITRCGVDTNKYLEYRVVGSGTAYISIIGYYEDL